MKQKGQIQIGNKLLKSEIEIHYLIDDAANLALFSDLFDAHLSYAAYVEFGLRPEEKSDERIVEGSLVEPITDEKRLLS